MRDRRIIPAVYQAGYRGNGLVLMEERDALRPNAGGAVRQVRRPMTVRLALLLLALVIGAGCGNDVVPSSGSVDSTEAASSSALVVPPTAQSRTVNIRWLPSNSPGVGGYDLFVGTSTGQYDAVLRIVAASAPQSPSGVQSYPVTLRSDVDYYMALRAFDGRALSPLSNEVHLPAIAPAPTGGGSPKAGGGDHQGEDVGAANAASSSSGAVESPLESAPAPATNRASPSGGADPPETTSATTSTNAPVLASIELDDGALYLGSSAPRPLGASGALSVSMWLRPFLDYASRRVLFDLEPAAGSQSERVTLSLLRGKDLELNVHDANGALAYQAVFELAPAADVWQHLAVVLDPDVDTEPRVYLDLGARTLLHSVWNGWVFGLSDAQGFLRIGGSPAWESNGYRGRLGHVAIWSAALSHAELREIHAGGHLVDLRRPVGAYARDASLVHYWRFGDADRPIGFDLGNSSLPADLDDPGGGVTLGHIVADGPAAPLE